MDLPKECLVNILRRLNLVDRVKIRAVRFDLFALFSKFDLDDLLNSSPKQVSKRFRSLVDECLEPITELVFCPHYRLNYFHRWWYTWQVIKPREHFSAAFDLSFETPLLVHLKKLKIKDYLFHDNLMRMQRFTELEVLEIGELFFGENHETVHFLKLRILYVQFIVRPNKTGSYTFNSPYLSAVYFGN